MHYLKYDVLLQEVPNEISLGFYMSGCPHRCKGCHSPELWTYKNSKPFNLDVISQYSDLVTCVLFLGGEWEIQLYSTLCDIKTHYPHLKLALYAGSNTVDPKIHEILDFIKLGPWVSELGGLDSPTTNQKFIDVKNNKDITVIFRR